MTEVRKDQIQGQGPSASDDDATEGRALKIGEARAGASDATTGQLFRNARELHAVSLDTAARDLNIRREFLDAIERDDYDALPDPAYAIGFVRSYAKYLRLEAPEAVNRFRQEIQGAKVDAELMIPVPVRDSRLPVGVLAIIAIVMAGLAYGSWVLYTQHSDDIGVRAAAAAPKSPASNAINAAVDRGASGGNGAVAAKAGVQKVGAKPFAHATARPGPQRVVLRARANTWIRVRDAKNNVLFTRVLRQGDQYPVPGEAAGMVADIGNAGGLEIVLNGRVLRPIGPANMPVYNLSLSPESLKKRNDAALKEAAAKQGAKKDKMGRPQ